MTDISNHIDLCCFQVNLQNQESGHMAIPDTMMSGKGLTGCLLDITMIHVREARAVNANIMDPGSSGWWIPSPTLGRNDNASIRCRTHSIRGMDARWWCAAVFSWFFKCPDWKKCQTTMCLPKYFSPKGCLDSTPSLINTEHNVAAVSLTPLTSYLNWLLEGHDAHVTVRTVHLSVNL